MAMSEVKMRLTGRKAAAAVAALLLLVGVRLMTFRDSTGDAALMSALETLLVCDYFPNEAGKVRAAYESGDKDKLSAAVSSVTSARLNVESVQLSYPPFDFSSKKEVVVKVVYSLKDDSGTRDRRTKYYLFTHGGLANPWRYEHETTAASYYLNFH